MALETFRKAFQRPFQFREFLDQTWMIARVSLVPTLLVAIPFTVLVAFTLNILLREIGAADLSGAGTAFGTITQLGPVVTVLVVAGAGATAICADLGARTIREEIDAMRVLGIDPIQRLVVPRVLASTFVALLLNGLVSAIGIAGGYVFSVLLQGVNPGAFVSGLTVLTHLGELILSEVKALLFGVVAGLVGCYRGLTVKGGPKGVGIAVNETVVYAFICLFVINVIMTAIGVRVLAKSHGDAACRVVVAPMSYDATLRVRRFFHRFAGPMDAFGEQALFYGESMRYIPNALTRYRKETIRLIAEMTMGTGALVLIGGTVGVAAFLTLASGGVIAVQGYESLGNIGIEALTGFLSAFLNVRIVAPVVAGIALAATIGAGTTAQLGAMRVAEEIDAVEAMAVHSVSYLVSTRLIAGLIAIVPLYSLAVLASFFAARFTTVFINGQSAGLYDHYFNTFLIPTDLLWSFLQAIVMSIGVMLIHTYYGYNASGGPVGVGLAVGQAVRTSLIVVVVITLFISLAVYGASGNFNLSG